MPYRPLITAAFIALGLSLTSPVFAQQNEGDTKAHPKLQFPLDCTLGETCWIARYGDRQQGKGKADYMCGRRTQDRHRGTDFVIDNYSQMQRGVPVLAALDGVVFRMRDGVKDEPVTKENKDAKNKVGCGNVVVLKHEGGYQTSYCHMRESSIPLKVGDSVKAGDRVGFVGLSGLTEYPHMHFDLRKDGKRIDPFDGARTNTSCGKGTENSLWAEKLPYEEMVLMPLLFSSEPLTRQTRWHKQAPQISKDAGAIVLTGRAWNVLKGDRWLFHIIRPDGVEATERSLVAEDDRQSQWYANRYRPGAKGLMTGTWKGRVMVIRQHEDGTISKYEEETSVEVVD